MQIKWIEKPISPKISERFSVKITFKERSNVRILLTKSCKEAFPIIVEIRIMECNLNSRVKFLWNKINYLKVTMKLSGLEIKLRLNFIIPTGMVSLFWQSNTEWIFWILSFSDWINLSRVRPEGYYNTFWMFYQRFYYFNGYWGSFNVKKPKLTYISNGWGVPVAFIVIPQKVSAIVP